MAGTKTTFFGSMFAFEQAGVDEVVERFREGYAEDADDAPFISYDKINHLFKLDKLNLLDDDTPETVLRILKLFTEQQHNYPDHLDEKIRPLEGFLSRMVTEQPAPVLLDIGSADDEQQDAFTAMQHAFTEWRPANGNIKILTRGTAESIAKQTGTELLPEPSQSLVRLVHGDFHSALQKLKNLEPLMLLQYQQRDRSSNQASSSVLLTVDEARRPLLGFQSLNYSQYPGFHRIIVPTENEHSLLEMFVCEARVTRDGVRKPHPNIEPNESAANVTMEPFPLWSSVEYKEVGEPANMEPRVRTPATRSEVTFVEPCKQKYLDPNKAADVAGWAGAVDIDVDPNAAVPEIPLEPASKRRRRVAIDSDDEEEERNTPAHSAPIGVCTPALQLSRHRRNAASECHDHSKHSATRSQSETQSSEDSYSCDETQPLSRRDAPSVAVDRLLSEVSVQKACSNPPSSAGPQHSDLLRDEPDAFSLDVELPASLVKHFTILERDTSVDAERSTEQTRDCESDLYASSCRKYPVIQRSREHGRMGTGRIGAQQETTSERQKPLTLSELSFPDFPEGEAPGIGSPQTPNLMDANEPWTLPHPSNANMYHDFREEDAASDEVAGQDQRPLNSVSLSYLNSSDFRKDRRLDVEGKQWENHVPYKGRNLQVLRQEAMADLQAQIEREETGTETAQPQDTEEWFTVSGRNQRKKTRGDHQQVGGDRQRKAADTKPPIYHSTMSQKAPNPGKKGSSKQQPVSAADRARRMEVIYDAYGPLPTRAAPKIKSGVPQLSDMTNKKKSALSKNDNMTTINADATQQAYRRKETEALKNRLNPVFEACRAFHGSLEFVIHFGQALLSTNPNTDKGQGFDLKSWEAIFGLDAQFSSPSTSFSKVLTANGAELDRLLEARSRLSPTGKMFNKDNSGETSVTYEFCCQSKNAESFVLELDENKNYTICNATETVDSVCMQCPARIWDACATVQGAERLNHRPTEMETIEGFVDSIYIAPGHLLHLYFRQPTGNVLAVNNPRMKRVSVHQCLLPGHENYQLRITEFKTLRTRNSPHDRKLWKAQEDSYDQMVRDGTLHYEMCLFDSNINHALKANQDIEIGEMTDATTTGKSLIKGSSLQPMLELTVAILNKIDYVGFHNIGTMRRLLEARTRHEQSLPPTLRSHLRPIMPASHVPTPAQYPGVTPSPSLPPGLAAKPSEISTGIMKPIPGIRMNTVAEVYADAEGNLYQKGMGGARVPVAVPGHLVGISEAPIEPEDSASQYGAPRWTGGRGASNGVMDSATRPAGSWNAPDTRGPGFW